MLSCPRCQNILIETIKNGVAVDVCSGCGGIWLDKGELGKLLQQVRDIDSALDQELGVVFKNRGYRHDDDDYQKYHYKKKSMFKKIFDIFD